VFRLTSLNQDQDGSADFERGLDAYRNGSMTDALAAFNAASASAPGNALVQYYRALAMKAKFGTEMANEALQLAVEAERQDPVKNWGKTMERVQGHNRVWVEKARRDAGLVR
jgi:predicted Zn-dependent protease